MLNLRTSKNHRAEINFSGIFMILLVLFALWGGAEWSIGYFGSVKARNIVTETILSHRDEASDEALKEMILEALKTKGPIEMPPENLELFRSQDGSRLQVKFKYIHRRQIPFLEKPLEIPFESDVEESLKRSAGN